MKHLKRFFILVLCVLPWVAGANVATTAGSNLTAWNGNSGATNNNNWNTLMNNRTLTGGTTAKADFGNCNSLILRCAQPKCAACTTMELAVPVVSGCVNSSKDCKKHGDELVQYIAAQIVASAAAKLQEQQLAMQQAQAQAAAAQNSQQMAQMQQQMVQMQQQMQQQNATQMAQMQAALEEQKALVAQAQQEAAAAQQAKIDAQTAPGVTAAQQVAIESGVSKDTLVRQQIGGEVLSTVENAEAQLIKLKETMDEIFSYAKCDARGNNCSGPKRVKMFKEKAMQFFDPYDAIADEMYDALETALAVGVDVSDVIMMLSGSCNKWGKYMCTGDGTDEHKPVAYKGGKGDDAYDDCGPDGKSEKNGRQSRGGFECRDSQIIPPQDDVRCTLIGMISDSGDDDDTVERNWLSESYDGDKFIRVGCASSALDSIAIFGRRKSGKNRTLDLDTLERIIVQDAPEYGSSNRYSGGGAGNAEIEKLKYCALTPNGYTRLRNAVTQKKMPDSKVCVSDTQLTRNAMGGFVGFGGVDWNRACSDYIDAGQYGCNGLKEKTIDGVELKDEIEWKDNRCKFKDGSDYCYFDRRVVKRSEYDACTSTGGKFQSDGKCNCGENLECTGNDCTQCEKTSKKGNPGKGETIAKIETPKVGLLVKEVKAKNVTITPL